MDVFPQYPTQYNMIERMFELETSVARCKYPSKICRNLRTRKRNGQLHRFCEEHRKRANLNQKRWIATRRGRWDALDAYEAITGHPQMLSPRDCDSGFVPETIDFKIDPTWQPVATDELHEFLGDLLLSEDALAAAPSVW